MLVRTEKTTKCRLLSIGASYLRWNASLLFLIEEYKGAFPLWLSPVQVKVLPVNLNYHESYATEVKDILQKQGIRVELDLRNEKLGYKIREAQTKRKFLFNLVIGDKEVENRSVTYRVYGSDAQVNVSLESFIEHLKGR